MASKRLFGWLSRPALSGYAVAWAASNCDEAQHLRSADFRLLDHHHGKTRVKVLKVTKEDGRRVSMHEYAVETRLWSPKTYAKVFTAGDNAELVATDTQKNQVYVVAKLSDARTPEDFGIDIATHLLTEYKMLTKVQVEVEEIGWARYADHDHAFLRQSPQTSAAIVSVDRKRTEVTSQIRKMTFIKPTQSGFVGYLKDKCTLLPECTERCLASELTAEWTYTRSYFASPKINYQETRDKVMHNLLYGLFGPSPGGVYSPSLQNTIYDAACLVLKDVPHIADISIATPNLHYLPMTTLEKFDLDFQDDVFIPTSEPSGTIYCKVSRS